MAKPTTLPEIIQTRFPQGTATALLLLRGAGETVSGVIRRLVLAELAKKEPER